MKIRFFVADKLKYDLINEGCFYNDVVYAISNCLNNDYDSEDAFESDVRALLGVAADDTQYEGKDG
jgi:hypothetical protein